nr:hypothetical protein [Cytophagales bacterium]
MDIIFECGECGQELEVDEAAAGSELICPTCRNEIIVPEIPAGTITEIKEPRPESSSPVLPRIEKPPVAKEVAAKLSVPFSAEPTKELIKKPNKPLEVAAKDDERVIRVKTIRRADCRELERDNFDDVVTQFLQKVGQEFIIAMHPVSYSTVDSVSQKLIDDYGLMIIYRG